MKRHFSAFVPLAVVIAMLTIASCSEDGPLNPGNGGDIDTIPPNPTDSIPPSLIIDPRLALDGQAAVLRWTAPHDNEVDDPVHHYEIRYVYTTGMPPVAFWDFATPVLDPPKPGSPGSQQTYAFATPSRGRDLWVGLRSFDAAGNRSENSDLVVLHIPGLVMSARCIDALTGAPIEALDVRVAAGGPSLDLVTDANGEFTVDDLLPGAMSVEIRGDNAGTVYHRVNQVFIIAADTTHTFVMIEYQAPIAAELSGMSMLRFFKILTETTSQPILAKWHRYPVKVFVPPYVNKYGVDYEAISKAAAQRWMDKTGMPLFEFVDSAPDTGVVVAYKDSANIAPNIALTRHLIHSDLHPIYDEIHVLNDFEAPYQNFLYQVMLHEFGHTIRFGHLASSTFIMFGSQPLPADISDDEANAVIMHQALPTRIDMSIFDDSIP